MTVLAPVVARDRSSRVALALGRIEARRILRHPVLAGGLVLSGIFGLLTLRFPDDWSGARYTVTPVLLGPVMVAISMAVAGSFHRERTALVADAPVGEEVRAGGRVLGGLALAALVTLIAAVVDVVIRARGGLDLGDAPGRTLHAQFALTEVLQQPSLAILAVGAGAAAGRRLASHGSALLLLFTAWFPMVFVVWGFQDRAVVPLSIIQLQPVSLPIATQAADPSRYPADWLLSAPGEFQSAWMRLFTSGSLAGWHDLYLLGLAALLLGVALPRGPRIVLVPAGAVAVAIGVTMQYLVIP